MTRQLLTITGVAVTLIVPPHSITAARPATTIIDLGTLGGGNSDAFGMNNDQVNIYVVGWSDVAPRSNVVHAFFWTSTGGMTDLGTLPGGTSSQGFDVNNNGQIAGFSN